MPVPFYSVVALHCISFLGDFLKLPFYFVEVNKEQEVKDKKCQFLFIRWFLISNTGKLFNLKCSLAVAVEFSAMY